MPIAGLLILECSQFGKSFPGHRALAGKKHLYLNKSPTSRPKLLACNLKIQYKRRLSRRFFEKDKHAGM